MKKLLALISFALFGFLKVVAADVTAPAGRFIQIRGDLQPSSTFYVSSGTVQSYLAANGIMSLPHSATPPPADCDTEDERGRVYIDTNAVSGSQIYVCEGTLGWIAQAGGGGGGSGTTILVKDGGSSIVNTSTLNFTGATFVVTNSGGEGLVAIDFSSVPSRSDVVLNQNLLQSGATFYVSSGTVGGQLSVTSIKFPNGTIQVSSPTAGVGSTPAGSNTQVQFNDGGGFGASPKFAFDKSSSTILLLNDYRTSTDLDALAIRSSATYANSPAANISWQFRDAVGSTQTVFQISAAQASADTSTSTLVSFKVRGDNILDTVLRIGEPSGSTVPYVEFPTTGTRLNFVGTGAAAYIENNPTSLDLTIVPTTSANRLRIGSGSSSNVALYFDASSNDGNVDWSSANDRFEVSDDVQMQAQNEVRFADADSSNYVGFKAPDPITSNRIWTLPSADGTSGQALTTNGSGTLSFTTISGGGGGSGTTIRVENQGSFTVNSSTINFGRGLIATDDVGEAKVELDPTSYVGSQIWSDGASDPTITVTYAVAPGTGPEWTYTDDNISTLNDFALPDLNPNQPLKLNGLQVVISEQIDLSDTTNEVTGVLPAANLGAGSTNYIQNRATLQSGATFYVSSGTAVNFNSTSGNITNLLSTNTTITNLNATNATLTTSLTTNMYANFGSPYLVPYLDATNKFTTNANFLFADFANILYGPSILATTEMGAYNGASIVAYDNDSSHFVKLKSSASLTNSNTYVLPASSGTSGQAILTDGANNLYFGSAGMSPGATFYIQNTNSLQSGATFYVSSGTVEGQFNVISASATGFGSTREYFSFNPRTSTFQPGSNLTLNMVGNSGFILRGANIGTSAYSDVAIIPPISGNEIMTSFSFNSGNEVMSVRTSEVRISTKVVVTAERSIELNDADNSNFVGFKSSSTVATNNTYVLPASSGSANQLIFTDGSNNLGFKDVRRAMKFSQVFNAEQAKLPGANPCVISNSTAATIPSLLCDASTDESASWSTILTEYTTTTMRADIYYTMVSTNSGAVVHNIQVMCASTTYTSDLDVENFGSVNASTITVPSSIGRIGVATVTVSAMPTGCVSGGLMVMKYNRDANAASDTAPGDIEIRKIWLFEP